MVLDNRTQVVRNTTHALWDGVDNPYSRLLRIEVLVSLNTVLLVFLFFFGSSRRRWKSTILRTCIWTAYTLSHSIVPYTVGLMQSAPFRNDLFAIWAVFLLYSFGSVDSISAYNLEDNQQVKKYAFEGLVQVVLITYLMVTYISGMPVEWELWCFWSIGVTKIFERWCAFLSASRSSWLLRKTRLVADVMIYEHELSSPGKADPTVMRGYNYLVTGEEEIAVRDDTPFHPQRLKITHEIITLQKIWECHGRLVTPDGDPDRKLKDMCLSFAWYKMLKRRFTGYPLHECDVTKTWELINRGFLSSNISHERAFRVIEVELGFIYDTFYTKYEEIFCKGKFPRYKCLYLLQILLFCSAIILMLSNYQTPMGHLNRVTESGTDIDVLITYVVISTIFILELSQLVAIVFSDWVKVLVICSYVERPTSLREKAVCPLNLLCLMTIGFVDKTREGQKASSSVNLPEEVKSAVLCSLRTNGRQLSNGQSSLQRNQMGDELSWACSLETHTHSILVWHIANSFCEIAPPQQHTEEQPADRQREEENHRLVATSLSRYCAYLVAFVPVLLPDHAYTTELIFDKVVQEARKILEECQPKSRLYENMMTIDGGNSAGTIIGDGIKLGKQLLEIQDQGQRWKVLADFWAEMMLFLAPSDNATAHAENLANVGEFITHLWALLTHAGILHRNSNLPA
ncbi:uncharacterized protein LOC131220066 [Magnolia sinica]|uniref:uncharacterized protein LOC131220066 n=1 Tax=Magnolia sinica TaxID=86752 RepID=UPI00265945FD|nr:uncharacterized protein LOC131220066 [Magnolia sinica]